MHHALAASWHFADAACVQAAASTNMPPWCSYLWPASLPNEPMVRIGLEGLTQVGSGVFCTSVLTSGSISEGEGVSFAPAMVPSGTSSREPVCSFLPSSSWCRCSGSVSQSATASPGSLVLHECGGSASPSLPHHGLLSRTLRGASGCLVHPLMEMSGSPCVSNIHASSRCNVNPHGQPSGLHGGLHNTDGPI